MNNQSISNPKVEVEKGLKMNKKDILMTMLAKEKSMTKDYTTAMTEASNKYLYEKYKVMFEKIISLQRKIYETMFKYGWYCLEKVDQQKVLQKLETLNQELTDLNQQN